MEVATAKLVQWFNELRSRVHLYLHAQTLGPARAESGSQGDDQPPTQHNAGEERVIFVNAPHQPAKYKNNHITTAKYSFVSFVPLFLFEQFRRYSNCFFLFIALMQQIPDVSPTGRWTTLVPLIFILSVSALKEIVEDVKRHRADDEINMREVEVLRDRRWQWIQWRAVAVGDVVKVHNNTFFPADLVLLSSSEPQSMSFIETANLDGETNLKIRQAHPDTASLLDTAELMNFRSNIQCEPPNRHLYEFHGVLRETNKQSVALGPDQLLLRGAMLRNTQWVFGVVIYTGHDTKLMQNNTATAPLKRSTLDRLINTQILMLFFILLLLCILSAIFNVIWTNANKDDLWYLGLQEEMTKNFAFNLLTFIILFNNLIPISLQVTLEVVRFVQATFINMDIEMYHADTDTPAMARTSNLNEELGMVNYIFTDKTGTLTKNVMEFKRCSVGGKLYELPNPLNGNGMNGNETNDNGTNDNGSTSDSTCELIKDIVDGRSVRDSSNPIDKKKAEHAAVLHEFMVMLSVCHTVIPEKIDNSIIYHAASPDERALVDGARNFNYVFDTRTPNFVEVVALGETLRYEILNVIEFTSARKRMSVVVKTPEGKIKIFCKGADSVIYERLKNTEISDLDQEHVDDFRDITLDQLKMFASEGLRTLCFASAEIPENVYQWWRESYHKAAISIINRESMLEEAANLIETKLILLGATAIEDQLQDQVPETIQALLQADINVWVLTGDKQETAINIGYSCKLITNEMPLYVINESSLDKTREVIIQRCLEFGIDLKCQNDVALIIDGSTLDYALSCDIRMDFLELCSACKVVICCRVSPIQKAEVVDLITSNKKAVTLAIGDGANDVAMIQKAHIGVGISGVEGLQAACASDYSIAQFRFLKRLLFVHGSWNYSRMCKLILYSFYKNICLYVIELWFAIYSGWSGQILFERWSIGLYNVLFTAAPPLAMGLFDKVCSAETRLAHPGLYATKNNGDSFFNIKIFWIWIINALFHSALLYWLPLMALEQDVAWGNGRDGGYLLLGNFVYTYVVVTVCAKAGLIINSWTWVTHLATWGSIILWFLFIFIYSNFWPVLNVGAVMLGNDKMLFTSPVFWLGLILIPTAVLLLDVTVNAVMNTVWKSVTEAARENEIRKSDPGAVFNNQDYRSSLTETARLLKNVKSVFTRRSNAASRVNVEVELSHGFAFSQEEGGSVTQTDVIRAYDTNLPKPGGM
ncbi:probable phospholipid-transporting ATPase IA isoform X5 [Nylanderia fulva]|uniref:probable phospholipid-transporting ATPase IA isoform X5 n=1 Tax=Nylanderia fulva TaxID=613905 RepID=UPI0010FBAB11|nr:probable phospholipid-transporting ATPase IA isoform X5 [Nylanderia fulva]XP_029161029.1 probable phospholipid-transporting ATPase IA isoform X5 [Nylanderia fulva]XP_029161030.1 probable phospholipid-transporting ATPase IA isoform X5 [Nylanderia fulva]XP_029161031.1 probable phospholipid-transporting ATPase IA isoform X5 [Nylanderia fulva]XP_029161032.1 probable phospholipid-transporting ATPase IA isoform X5 [Nylanderia fulva]